VYEGLNSVGDEAAQRIPGRRIPVYSNHEGNIKQFEAWIQESFDNTESAFGNGHDLPKRVFDVSEIEDSGAVSLKKFDAPTQGRYIALSHCWGKSLPVKTTTENIQEHRRSIRLNKLTPTFRDAIFLSHRFGVQYLWIDSLCILQDSKEDWETEAAKMGDYELADNRIGDVRRWLERLFCFTGKPKYTILRPKHTFPRK
jgi:hypothetical protein